MAQRNDQVFQLSLTEIAFTISFILLILLGYLVFKEESGRIAAEAALSKIQTDEQATAALNNAKGMLVMALKGGGTTNPDEVITKLIAAADLHTERDRLKQQVEDLDAKLTALTELQNQLQKAAKADRSEITKEEIDSALALQEQVRQAIEQESFEDAKPVQQADAQTTAKPSLPNASSSSVSGVVGLIPSKVNRNKEALTFIKQSISATGELKKQLKKQLNKDLKPGQETQTVQEVVSAAKSFGELAKNASSPETIRKENSDLRGQVAFLKHRLDARGGRDFPPCWADESGKVEFLFSLEMKSDSVAVIPAWPSRRETAASALPGIAEALAGPHSNHDFVNSIQAIFNWSKKQTPECRFYVQLKSSISDAVQSDRARLMVENYFYKVEARR